MEPVRVVIGTEENQYIPQRVLEYSIRKHATIPVDIRPVYQKENRVGGTNFGFVRFNVPKLCGYKGRAIYLDADQLVFTDIKELYNQLDEAHKIALVNEPEGYFGGKEVPKHNQTSVMVLDCEALKDWDPSTMFDHVVANRAEKKENQIHYRDFMTLSWFDQKSIKPLSPQWNHFNIIDEKTKLVHFSHVRSQPWKNTKHSLSTLWTQWLKEAIQNGYVSRVRLVWEIMKGHIDKSFLKYAFT